MAGKLLLGRAMGRSFKSVRMASKDVSDWRLKANRAMKKGGAGLGQRLAEMAKMTACECFLCS